MTTGGTRRRAAITALCVVQFMVVLDSTITTVALGAIRADLAASEDTLQYVITLYAAAFGGLLLVAGRVTDLAGGRRVFVAGAATFTAASLLCAVATTMPLLLVGRSVQGAGAAFGSAAAFALLLDLYPEGPARNRVLGIWAALGASGAAAGLILGGVLIDLAGWHLVFAVNVPLGAAAVALAGRVLPSALPGQSSPARAARLDLPGAVTVTLGTVMVVLAITRASTAGWSQPGSVALLAAAAALLGMFVIVEARASHPLVPLPAFTRGPVPAAAVVIACLMAVVGSQGFFLVLYLQQIVGLGSMATGLAIVPSALAALVASTAAARLAGRVPVRALAAAGLLLVAGAQVLLGRLPVAGSYPRDLLPGLVLFGFGLGTAFVGTTIAGTAGLGQGDKGLASGILNTAQQLGIAVGVAALVSVTTVNSTRPAVLASSYGTGLRLSAFVALAGIAAIAAESRIRAVSTPVPAACNRPQHRAPGWSRRSAHRARVR